MNILECTKKLKDLTFIFVSTDNEDTAQIARDVGVKSPFIRPPELSLPSVGLPEVLKFSLNEIEKMC